MNARLLYATTVALAVASSLAFADEARPLSREQVVAQYTDAAARGTLRKTDYDFDRADYVAAPTKTRDQVVAELAAARANNKLIGPLRSGSYNPYGDALLRPSTLARADVRAEVLVARQEGTLRRTDYDDEIVTHARPAGSRANRSILAQGVKTQRAGS